jgi:beta-fructofuranosidase
LNDPHAVVHLDGTYHLFHQAVPGSTSWAPEISWGHATSEDLVTWHAQPTALEPADDEVGCWTGCIVVPEGEAPVVLYTSVAEPDLRVGRVRLAHPTDQSLSTWAPGRLLELPMGDVPGEPTELRDPAVRWDGTRWRMVLGGGYADGRPVLLGWSSADLHSWTFDGEVASGPPCSSPKSLGAAWECPQLVEVDGRTVALVCTWEADVTGEVFAAVGDLDGHRFEGEGWTQVTFRRGHYAPTVFTDADGRPCVIFWIRDVSDPEGRWAGALSVAYVLSVVDGRPALTPHPAVRAAGAVSELPAAAGHVELVEDGDLVELCTGRAVIGWSSRPAD